MPHAITSSWATNSLGHRPNESYAAGEEEHEPTPSVKSKRPCVSIKRPTLGKLRLQYHRPSERFCARIVSLQNNQSDIVVTNSSPPVLAHRPSSISSSICNLADFSFTIYRHAWPWASFLTSIRLPTAEQLKTSNLTRTIISYKGGSSANLLHSI